MRFYTYPEPFNKDYPWILCPFHILRRTVRSHGFRHLICDVGVEIFAKGAKEYPAGFFEEYIRAAKYYTSFLGDKIWFVIPDYPDDYVNNPIEDNVERTLRNIERFFKVDGVNWVFPLQADYMDLESFRYSCREVRKYNPARVAIGTVCKTNNVEFIERCCRMARMYFPGAWIHAFGPTLRALPRILRYIDSWDSSAFFTSRIPGQRMCKNKREREQYYREYLDKVNRILSKLGGTCRLTSFLIYKYIRDMPVDI